MYYNLRAPKALRCRVDLPASKSICNRALVINALAKAKTLPHNLSDCDDTAVLLRALTKRHETVDIMGAGTAMRFLTAYLSTLSEAHTLTGTERMKHRPISILVEALRSLGANIEYLENDGFPPLHISGGSLRGGDLTLSGGVSSQYVSALLMIAPVLSGGLTLHLTGNIISRPYIDLTLYIMHVFGAQVKWTDERTLRVEPHPYRSVPYYVEADWSAASYWYEMMALTGDADAQVMLVGLLPDSAQGDRVTKDIFEKLGVHTEFVSGDVPYAILTKRLCCADRLDYDFVNCPDLAQTLAVTCAMLGLPFRLTGLQSLKIKETDRLAALVTELRKLGCVVEERNGDELAWNGVRAESQRNALIETYDDHRMALSFAPSCFKTGGISINNPQVVSKSYPHFWEHLRQAGFILASS